MKVLVLAEKPSVGRELARVLDCGRQSKGSFEGKDYVVTWALGHLVTLKEPEDYEDKYREWRLEDLPMLPGRMDLKVIKKTGHQFNTVKNLMKRDDIGELVIATDAGREGELVARWIMKLAGWKKPIKRLWISSQTDEAIRKGFAGLKPGHDYDNLYQAAVCRSEADWLIGLNVSRALTCKFNAQLNAGRVQTPTLSMIISREKEIRNFKPVPYWTIRADFGDYFAGWRGPEGGRIFDAARAEEIRGKVEGKTGIVESVATKEKSEPPPLAYDLTELQRDANKRFGYSAKKTLSILQDLYERHKLVTYPRTDSRYITRDIVPTLPERLKAMGKGPYERLVKSLAGPLSPGKRLVDDNKVSDHHAIIPTEQPLSLAALNEEERRVYDLIARRFIAVLYPPYRYDQTTIVTTVSGEKFYSRGKVVKEMGWREVSSSAPEEGDEELPEQILKEHREGEAKPVKSCKLDNRRTTPPPRYTEGTLLTAMESAGKFIEDEELRESIKAGGLGTPATRAEIIEKLCTCSYIERSGNHLQPTSKGMQLMDLVPDDLQSPELTAKWELRLSQIAKGKEPGEHFMADIRDNAVKLVASIKADTATYRADNISKTRCPLCGKYMLFISAKKGKMLACSDRACGHRQPEKMDDIFQSRPSRGESRKNKALIERYSGRAKAETNIGELLKEALRKREEREEESQNSEDLQ